MSKTLIHKLNVYLIIAVLIFYNFHRYIFKYNSELTSPTYTNTPLIWQIGKYPILTILVLFFYLGSRFRGKLNDVFIIIYGFVLFVLLINIGSCLFYGDISFKELEYCFYFILALPYCFVIDDLVINWDKVIRLTAISLFLSNLAAMYNFVFTGRLPALGYEGGLVRFGGFWDDPNGYGFICVFFLFYFLIKRRYFLVFLTFVSILFTFSFTAYIMLCFSTVFWLHERFKSINYKVILGIVLFIVLIIVVVLYNYDYISDLMTSKSGSLDQHLSNSLVFNLYPLANTSIQFSETWYLSFFYNYFPVSVPALAGCCYLLYRSFKKGVPVMVRFYLFIYLFYCLFLPMYYVFPLNFIFIVLLIFSLKGSSYSKTMDNVNITKLTN